MRFSRSSYLVVLTTLVAATLAVDPDFELDKRQVSVSSSASPSRSTTIRTTTRATNDDVPTSTRATSSSPLPPPTSASPTRPPPTSSVIPTTPSPTPPPPTSEDQPPPPPSSTEAPPPPSSATPSRSTTVVTVTNDDGSTSTTAAPPESATEDTTPTNTGVPSLGGTGEKSGSSGLSDSSKKVIAGVVGGVGGAILLGGIALVAWRVWGRKKGRSDDYDDVTSGGTDSIRREKRPSNAGITPFQSTLDQYHTPAPKPNAAANF